MPRIIDWETIKERILYEGWAAELYSKTVEDLDVFIENYHDEASRVTGWFHHYNCEKCQGRLIFNIDDMENHECSVCHHVNSSETLTRVWNNMYRGRANQSIYNSAVAYRVSEDGKYLRHIERILDFYSENYDDFISDPIAKRFEGKLMNQHLDDASSMMNIMLGLSMVRDSFSEEKFKYWYEKLFKREAELFDFFANRIYNIPVWVKCAQAMTGVFFNEPEHIQKGFYSPYGVLDQLNRGVTAEGMWYEGSMHYHFYTIQPIAYLMFICRAMDFHIPEMPYIYDTVERMFEYPVKMMFSSKRLPNPNDAHPYLDIFMYRTHYEYAAVIYDNPVFRKLCSIFNQDSTRPGSFNSLLLNTWNEKDTQIEYGTVINPDACTAMLRKEGTEVFFKFGILTGLHMHPDVMNFEMSFDGDVVSYDIGNGGYASSLFVEWQRKTLCHNTVVVDQTDQHRRNLPRGSVEESDIENAYIKAKAKAVYEATDYTRAFRVSRDRVEDEFEVHNWDTHEIDWFFYCEGEQKCSYKTEKVETLADDFLKNGTEKDQIMMPPRQAGYQHLLDIEKFMTDDDWYVDFELPDKTIRVTMKGEPGTTVHLFDSYTANMEKRRRGIMVRRTADRTTFRTTYECIRK
ncbi:MAG TPA: heparinase II/III family protein [Clostridia bacterium]|nr:heparinase II/III family protein [Clostridia bacterium]